MKHQYQHLETVDPMILAVLDIIASDGLGAIRSREIARLSGQSAAAVNRRFGSQETLVREAILLGTDRECKRLEQLITALPSLSLPPDLHADALVAILHDTHFSESEAAAFRWTVFAHEGNDLIPQEAISKLNRTLGRLWAHVAHLFGWSKRDGPVLHSVLEGFGRGRLITRHPLVFRGWAHDLCRRLVARLSGKTVATGHPCWRDQLVRSVGDVDNSEAASFAPTKGAIIEAAATCLVKAPLPTISHRSIASEAGVSLSSMTHHFQSLEEILWFGCLRMITQMVEAGEGARIMNETTSVADLADRYAAIAMGPSVNKIACLEQLQLYCHYRDRFSSFGDHFLLRQGQNSAQTLRNLEGIGSQHDRLDAVILHHGSTDVIQSIRRQNQTQTDQVTENDVVYMIERIFGEA